MFARFLPRLAAALLVTGLIVAAAWRLPLDGHAAGGLLQLAGRLHPLLLHFPVALLLLVPLLEFAGRRRPALAEAAGWLLGLAVPATFLAALAGLALAHADGHEGALVATHRLGGVLLTAATALTWLLRGRTRAGYLAALTAMLLLLFWTAHNGGSLTHGADYLTQPLPPSVKRILRIREAPAPETFAADTVFGGAVRPLLERRCVSCHGAEKQKGDYRMDFFAALLAGGKSGHAAIVPGDPAHSELVHRLLLDRDDEKVMPPRAKPRPTPAELALLQWWVQSGASRGLLLQDAKGMPPGVAALLAAGAGAPAGGELSKPVYIPRVDDYTAKWPQIQSLEKSLGIQLVPVSRQLRDGLILRTATATARFGDAQLAQLTPLAPYVVEAELSRTRLTDAAFATLKQFTHLARLHLDHTPVTGSALADLRGLGELTYLNLSATAVTDQALAKLAPHPALAEIYLFGSKVTTLGRAAVQAALPRARIGTVDAMVELAPASVPIAEPPPQTDP